MSREGDLLVIEPVQHQDPLLELLDSWKPLDEGFPEIEELTYKPFDL